MIEKVDGYKNVYRLNESSTNEELKSIYNKYDKINCIITNKNTRQIFSTSILGDNIHTINNKLKDNEFAINNYF